jgi:hypothetical protein
MHRWASPFSPFSLFVADNFRMFLRKQMDKCQTFDEQMVNKPRKNRLGFRFPFERQHIYIYRYRYTFILNIYQNMLPFQYVCIYTEI